MKALLAHGQVDVNEFNVKAVHQLVRNDFSPVICYANALQAAAVLGSRTMVETLIDNGAKVNLTAGYYGSALQAASFAGHPEIVELLLNEHGLDPNTQGGFYGNALQAAAARAHLELVKILLDAGACETTQGGHFGTALMAAVSASSKEIIDELLAHTTDVEALVNVRTEIYGTPLQKAAEMNAISIVEVLIANRADINALAGPGSQNMPADSTSALAIAARGGHKQIVSILCGLNAEADLSYSENQLHLLHIAAQQDMTDLVQYCLDQRCDINMTTTQGPKYRDVQYKKTPLSFACIEGHISVVELLLQKKARILHQGDHVTVLQLAAGRGHTTIVNKLVEEHRRRHSNKPQETLNFINRPIERWGDTPLIEALRWGTPSAVAAVLKHGASFTRDKNQVGPLHMAVWDGKHQVVEIILDHLEESSNEERLAQINARNVWGKTPIVDAAERNRVQSFNLLVRHGADCTIYDANANSLLHYVAWRNHKEIAKTLLREWEKEDPARRQELLNHQNSVRNTALQEAISRKNFDVIRLLVAAGAKLTQSHRHDYLRRFATGTPLSVFQQDIDAFEGHPEELRKYLNHRNGADGYSMLHDAAQHDRPDVAELLLAHGADATTMVAESQLDGRTVDLKTALHVATWEGRPRIVALLLEHAARQCDKATLARFVNRKNSVGKTALMDAAHQDRQAIMKTLLQECDADWTLTDNHGHNALHFCAFRGHRDCVALLLRHASGADARDPMARSPIGQQRFRALLNQQGDNGVVPLFDATQGGHRAIAQMLLEYHADYEIYDKTSDSILHRAVQADHDELLEPYLESMARDPDREKFRRVLAHRNTSMKRTVRDAAACRGRKTTADLIKKYEDMLGGT